MAGPIITKVVRWKNGMVMVFDQTGEQIPDYQGRWVEMEKAILRDKPDDVVVEGPYSWR